MMFFDSYAIIEMLDGNEKFKKYSTEIIFTNVLNLSEVFYSLLRRVDLRTANYLIESFDFEFIEVTRDVALGAATFKYENKKRKLSYADCIGYITSLKKGMKFLTGDKEFKNFDNVEFVKK